MRLINGNVERIAVSERSIAYLKAEGFKEMGEAETSPAAPEKADITSLDLSQLKALAKEKGIAGYSSLTKAELLAMLKDVV